LLYALDCDRLALFNYFFDRRLLLTNKEIQPLFYQRDLLAVFTFNDLTFLPPKNLQKYKRRSFKVIKIGTMKILPLLETL